VLTPVGASDHTWVAWSYGTGLRSDSMGFAVPANVTPGDYNLRLLANNTWQRLAVSNTVTVTAAGPSLAVSPVSPVAGGTLTVAWRSIAAPTATDWVGVYSAGAADADYVMRAYTNGRGTDRMLIALPNGISTGPYELRLFANNTLTRLATSNGLNVVPAPGLAAGVTSVPRGGKLSVSWMAIAAPTSTDWVTLNPVGALDTNWVAWSYTTGTAGGSLNLSLPSNVTTGTYELRLFANNTWQRLAVSNLLNVGPTLTTTSTPVAPGGTLTVTWKGIVTPSPADWLALVPLNAPDNNWKAWMYTSGQAGGSQAFVLPTTLPAGTYDLRLFSNNTFTRLALSDVITITAPGPSVWVSPLTATAGSTITTSWRNIASPAGDDWLGVYAAGAPDGAYLTRVSTGGLATGSTPLVLPVGLAAGQYELRLFSHDTLTRLAVGNSFTIQ
jgi:hypothetical protein